MEPPPVSPNSISTHNSILRRDAILNAIAFAGQQFLRSDDWNATVDAVLERLGQATGVERVYVFEDHTGPAGKPVASLRYEWVTANSQRLLPTPGLRNAPYFARSTARWRMRLQAGEIVTGRTDPSSPVTSKVLRLLLVRSFVAVPIFVAGQWWGAVGFADSQTSRDWAEIELDALQVAASLLGAAFERRQIARERAESERFWALMSRLSAAGLEAVDEHTLLHATVSQLAAVSRANHCIVLLWDEAAERATPAAATPLAQHLLASLADPAPPPGHIMDRLLKERRTLVYSDVTTLPPEYLDIVWALSIASGIAVPMIAQKRVLGAVLLGFAEQRSITPLDQERAELATQQLARFLANARLHEVTKQLNIQIWRQAEQLRQVIDAVSDAIVLLDSHNAVVLANTTFHSYLPALTGHARAATLDQVCGRPIEWFLEQDGGGGWIEVSAVGQENRIFAINANKVRIGPDAGGVVLSISDVTVEREQRKARHAQERLATIGALAGGIAHDFNNILQGIIGFADLLSKNPDIPASARQRLALMAGEGQRGAGLIRLIVEYSREVPLNSRPVNLEALIVRSASHWEASVQRPVAVSVAANGEPVWPVNGDAVRLLETLTALVADAAQTVPRDWPVAVRLANRTVVSDNVPTSPGHGPGRWVVVEITGGSQWFASPEEAYALQHDLPLIHLAAGRDTALAQVQGVVRQHRGAISVDSQPDGSRQMTLALPAAG